MNGRNTWFQAKLKNVAGIFQHSIGVRENQLLDELVESSGVSAEQEIAFFIDENGRLQLSWLKQVPKDKRLAASAIPQAPHADIAKEKLQEIHG